MFVWPCVFCVFALCAVCVSGVVCLFVLQCVCFVVLAFVCLVCAPVCVCCVCFLLMSVCVKADVVWLCVLFLFAFRIHLLFDRFCLSLLVFVSSVCLFGFP